MNEESCIMIKIAEEFSDTPGGRYVNEGIYSGEEFRDKHLVPLFENKEDSRKVSIFFDGAYGYPTSFLEEAFGGLARLYGADRCLERLSFNSTEDPLLEREIIRYINSARS